MEVLTTIPKFSRTPITTVQSTETATVDLFPATTVGSTLLGHATIKILNHGVATGTVLTVSPATIVSSLSVAHGVYVLLPSKSTENGE
jgi:hypothetical protein